VAVVAPVVVAALVSGNDAVAVIKAVNEDVTCDGSGRYRWYAAELLERIVAMLTKLIDP
jgi:hypothetical protein